MKDRALSTDLDDEDDTKPVLDLNTLAKFLGPHESHEKTGRVKRLNVTLETNPPEDVIESLRHNCHVELSYLTKNKK